MDESVLMLVLKKMRLVPVDFGDYHDLALQVALVKTKTSDLPVAG